MESDRSPVLRTASRLLAFQVSRDEMLRLDNRHLAFGLFCTWLVGIGRSWDSAEAGVAQHLGVGSVVYVFALSLLLWLMVRPLAPQGLAYKQVLTFVCLVSPPGLIYAVPVERFLDADTARSMNLGFLGLVAAWRVALLVFYLLKVVRLRWLETVVATLFPLATIMAPITVFRALDAIATGMGGLREGQKLNDPTQRVLDTLGGFSILAFLPLLIVYGTLAARRKAERASNPPEPESPD